MVVKQPNRWSCAGCVGAMIAGETLEDFIEFVGHDGSDYENTSGHPLYYRGFTMRELMQYLLDRGYSLGCYLISHNGDNLVVESGDIFFSVPVKVPAMLSVESRVFPGRTLHVVYWDGQYVRDPNPDVGDAMELHDYKIHEWWPVIRHQEV